MRHGPLPPLLDPLLYLQDAKVNIVQSQHFSESVHNTEAGMILTGQWRIKDFPEQRYPII